jgi:hypothetical protein
MSLTEADAALNERRKEVTKEGRKEGRMKADHGPASFDQLPMRNRFRQQQLPRDKWSLCLSREEKGRKKKKGERAGESRL